MPVRSADGTLLHVEVFGPDAAPTILLVHGWTCAIRFWQYQLLELPATYRVVAYDLRGHGRSERAASGDYSTDALAADVQAVIEACVPAGEKVLAAGHSMGGMSLVAWAGAHPDAVERRLAGAVLIDTGVENLVAEGRVIMTVAAVARYQHAAARQLVGVAVPLPTFARPVLSRVVRYVAMGDRATPAQVAFTAGMVVECKAAVRAAFGSTLARLNLRTALDAVTVPTMVIVGEQDRLTPPVHARNMAAQVQDGDLVELSLTGHMAPIEAYDEVTRVIAAAATH